MLYATFFISIRKIVSLLQAVLGISEPGDSYVISGFNVFHLDLDLSCFVAENYR